MHAEMINSLGKQYTRTSSYIADPLPNFVSQLLSYKHASSRVVVTCLNEYYNDGYLVMTPLYF